MTLLSMPREEQVAGPGQVRAIVEQEPEISAQLSLWRQAGSDVDIGQIRLVPLDSAIFYIMPVFLRGSESAIPQLQRIVVSDGVQVRMAPTLRAAVEALVVANTGEAATGVTSADTQAQIPLSTDWASRAVEVANAAEQALRNADFAEFGRRWAELQDLLRRAAARPPQ
jgi:hypothetical protein